MSDLIYTVVRGNKLKGMKTVLDELLTFASTEENIDREELLFISENLELDYKYTGIDFCNSFHVDKKILLVGAGFFGPISTEKDGAKYAVSMRLDKLEKSEKVTLATIEKELIGFHGEIFNVDFTTPILLEPSAVKYTLAFRLNGPPTVGLDPTKLETRIMSEGIEFYFWPGSQQMPIIRFRKIAEEVAT